MTFREKEYPGPAILSSPVFETDIIQATLMGNAAPFQANRYGHNDVREALDLIYNNKCAYCECEIGAVSTPHIDHHRPINSYAEIGNPQHHNGYYWLGYEWSNLVLSCPSCNGTKSSKFPLLLPQAREITAPPLQAGRPDYELLNIFGGFFIGEEPLLINPEWIDPDGHLTVNYFGMLEAIDNSIYGKTTIDVCDLNRIPLCEERQAILDKFIEKIDIEIFEHYRDDTLQTSTAQYQHRLNMIFEEIISHQHEEVEYNMLGRCIVDKFDELILEDIEPEFRQEVMDYFIQFLAAR